MSLTILLIIYIALAAILVIISLIALSFTWRFRYLGPATSVFVALFITAIAVNLLLSTWYILRTDWSYNLMFNLGSGGLGL